MSDTLRDRIAAAVLAELVQQSRREIGFLNHYEVYDDGEPTGKFLTGMDGSFDLNAVADAVIAALRADCTIVELPEPEPATRWRNQGDTAVTRLGQSQRRTGPEQERP